MTLKMNMFVAISFLTVQSGKDAALLKHSWKDHYTAEAPSQTSGINACSELCHENLVKCKSMYTLRTEFIYFTTGHLVCKVSKMFLHRQKLLII